MICNPTANLCNLILKENDSSLVYLKTIEKAVNLDFEGMTGFIGIQSKYRLKEFYKPTKIVL